MKKSSLNIGLIGLGRMGKNHLRVLSYLKPVNLKFIYDPNMDEARRLSQEYDVFSASDPERELAGLDAVVIASPTSTHHEYIRMAARYVRNIFIEKPMTDSLAHDEEILDMASKKNLNIQVGFIERFNPAIQALKSILSRAEKVVSLDFVRTDRVSSRITDADVVMDLMIHDIDLALHLNGGASEVFAVGTVENDCIDFAQAMIIHENGRFSRLQASRITERKQRWVSATCGDMFVECNLLSREVCINRQSVTQSYDHVYLSSVREMVATKLQEALLMELLAFCEFSGGSASADVPTALDGRNAAEVADRIRREIRRNSGK